MTYMTRQQKAVLESIEKAHGGLATAQELTERLHAEGQTIGLTTVYRQLEKLEHQGLVHKIVTDAGARWQYCDCHEKGHTCFMMKCERCGRVEHVDCHHMGELYEHLWQEHHFRINPHRTLLYGLCRECSEEEQD